METNKKKCKDDLTDIHLVKKPKVFKITSLRAGISLYIFNYGYSINYLTVLFKFQIFILTDLQSKYKWIVYITIQKIIYSNISFFLSFNKYW